MRDYVEDHLKDVIIKDLLYKREMLKTKGKGNKRLIQQIKEDEEYLYNRWLIIIDDNPVVKKDLTTGQLEFDFD